MDYNHIFSHNFRQCTMLPNSCVSGILRLYNRHEISYNFITDYKLTNFLYYFLISVLFPGGGEDFSKSDYGRITRILFNLAVKANDAGDIFPLWGTCLGFQFLSILGAGDDLSVLSHVDGENYSVPLNLSEGMEFY